MPENSKTQPDYRRRLFTSYGSTHIAYLDGEDESKSEWFLKYAKVNILPLLGERDASNDEILELACNKGFLLEALSGLRFDRLHGVDLSPADVEIARRRLPHASIDIDEAATYLRRHSDFFDVIIAKAMLEHTRKEDVLPLLEDIRAALKPNGLVIVDVPNMDWLFATHERYMDFTHEAGFTRESLAQVMRNVFDEVRVIRPRIVVGNGLKTRLAATVRPALVFLGNTVLRIMSEGASDVWWDTRSIIATGRRLKD